MTILLAIALLFLVRSIVRKPKRKPERTTTNSKPTTTNSMAALLAYQEQRANIENTIAELTALLDVSESAQETIRYKNMISTQYGKLASVESKIHKLL